MVWFALTGAGCEARLDDNAVWTGWRLPMKAGQRLTLKRPGSTGCAVIWRSRVVLMSPAVMGHAAPISKWGLAGWKAVY